MNRILIPDVAHSAQRRPDSPTRSAMRLDAVRTVPAATTPVPLVQGMQQGTRLAAQRAVMEQLHHSPKLVAQRLQIERLRRGGVGAPIQRVGTETKKVAPSPASVAQLDPDTWGYTEDVRIRVAWTPQRGADHLHHVKLDKITGEYSLQSHLLAGVDEVTGPDGNTTQANHQSQIDGLASLGDTSDVDPWYMLAAVDAHEHVHETSLGTALSVEKGNIEALFETVTASSKLSPSVAKAQMQAQPAFAAALVEARTRWDDQYVNKIDADHTGRTPSAERRVVNPMIREIRDAAKREAW